jgi:glycyl-tRNA synthetase beta chain
VATALADRLDTLVHCFRLGLKPKGSADPLGLRRAAGGLVVLVLGASLRTSLPALLEHGGAGELSDSDRAELVSFVVARARAQFIQRYATDLVDAVLATGDLDLVSLEARCAAMSQLAGEPEYDALKQTFKRVANITKELAPDAVDYDPQPLVEASEIALHEAFVAVRDGARTRAAAADFSGALSDLRELKPAVDRFFDEVMVMVDDDALRAARQGLLNAIAGAFRQIADFKHLS